jgi:hypothetical protein
MGKKARSHCDAVLTRKYGWSILLTRGVLTSVALPFQTSEKKVNEQQDVPLILTQIWLILIQRNAITMVV